ncbi:MAG TPA: thioredoxin family protein [Candidatus Paceibacterota bacterium]
MKNIELRILTSPGCAHCHDFLEYWKMIASDWPNISAREISLTTMEGQSLIKQYQIFASPGILLDDELVSSGGVKKEKFLEKLRTLSAC